jgi:dTMP kinase
MNGKLITLEGIDGSGKSTITKRLKRYFHDNPNVIFTREPTSEWIGEAVYRAISSEIDPLAELFLFIADHADHLSRTIKPALDNNKIIISDRYSDSRYAYQGATLKGLFEHPVEWVMGLHQGWSLVPEFTILFDVHPKIGITRVNNRSNSTKYETINFLEQVRSNYFKLVEMEPERFLVVNAEQPLDEVADRVLAAIKEQIKL